MFNKLSPEFYTRSNVVQIAKELIGKILITNFDNTITGGRIVETEAYAGVNDKASHSFGGRRTKRTEVFYSEGGVAYVYLCYGIHQMFNVITNIKDVPQAILIRAIEPMYGIEKMLERTGKIKADETLTRGPGNVAKALGLFRHHTTTSMQSDEIFIADDGFNFNKKDIKATPRIGVNYAGEDALLPYRFIVNGNKYVSKNR